ncbi:hypothetical protein NZK35_06605 [Stieleria sp. ICT_E10.1]|uniref:hypothetical protein n=1 Tax=Stieleria sedimenti TaxID=2976331 RepID=UPI0021800D02|nr:hypothetical protein [Stieleria sedimenti]MCS7466345.1 hypothetical protein [Stieleria sedimenti]
MLLAAGLLSISLHVGCAALPWRAKPTPTNTAYEDYIEQSVANIDYEAAANTPSPPVRLSGSPPASPLDRVAAASIDESCTSGCCH